MKRLGLLILMGILVAGCSAYASSGDSLPQTASHTVSIDVGAAYCIDLDDVTFTALTYANFGDCGTGWTMVTEDKSTAKLTYRTNSTATLKIQVALTAAAPEGITLKVEAGAISVTEKAAAAVKGSATADQTLDTTYSDFITGITGPGCYYCNPNYTIEVIPCKTEAKTHVMTVSYVLMAGS